MKQWIFLAFCLFAVISCTKDCDCVAPPFSDSCLGDTFDKFKLNNPKALAIVEYNYENEKVYLLDDGASHYDGVSPIINNQCDTICGFGGWVVQDCFKEMTFVGDVWRK